jgi:hypothetical protein
METVLQKQDDRTRKECVLIHSVVPTHKVYKTDETEKKPGKRVGFQFNTQILNFTIRNWLAGLFSIKDSNSKI